ncbi:restriction endonuclease subunit S [Streptomyces atroolivaceus]|uniref:restriction endonuclease subunit S n=1 Tax=Streptomyces atroolivaceus TaxID=66869 RepID=UPI0024E16621|nr:restriction endonuclease subunit S [Streptomyces atroolivaceus]
MGEWNEVAMGEILTVEHGYAFPGSDMSENLTGRPIIVSIGNFSYSGGFRFSQTRVRELKGEAPPRFLLAPGDLLVVMTCQTPGGEILGLPAIVPDDGRIYLHNQRIGKVKCREGVLDSRFAYYLFLSDSVNRQLASSASGTKILHTSPERIGAVRCRVPPLLDQLAIAEVLGALDDKIALNERIRQTALSLAGACYESVGIGNEPEVLGDLAELFDGPHATPHKTPTGPWFLSISSLKSGYLDLAESAHLSEEDFPRWARRVQPQGGDVLFSYETRLGDAALMPPGVRGSLGRRMALLRSKSAAVSGSLLLHAYLAPAFQEEIKRRTIHGATVDRLPLKEMPGWRISLPAAGERERLSAKLDALHTTVMQTADENRTLADLRDTLLPQLVTGKLRVKDATRVVEEAV